MSDTIGLESFPVEETLSPTLMVNRMRSLTYIIGDGAAHGEDGKRTGNS